MPLLIRFCLALCLVLAGAAPISARGEVPSAQAASVGNIVEFDSAEGQARLARATRVDLAPLRKFFEAQINGAYCGPATAVTVFNALADQRRHTQESFVAKGRKTRAQVLGEPMPFHGCMIRDGGYQLRQFDEMLRANGATTRLTVTDDRVADEQIRRELIENLSQPGNHVIINYRRDLVGQPGGGHISPLAAYDAASDSLLVLDVNPSIASWAWIPTSALIRAMRSLDVVENRGYVTVSR